MRSFLEAFANEPADVMSPDARDRSPYEIIEEERDAYLEELPAADPDWPTDVRIVYQELRDRLFDWGGGVEARDVLDDCGIGTHNIYGRFGHVMGHGIKEFVVHHRLQLAKRLLQYKSLSVTEIALAVGYDSVSGFCTTFRRHEGCSPTAFRKRGEE